jgi:outer membrane lipoprotein SlyB
MKNNIMKKIFLLTTILIATISASACQKAQPQAVYKQQELNTVSEGILGQVLNKREVKINMPDNAAAQPAMIQVQDAAGNVSSIPNPQASNIKTGSREVLGYEYVVKVDGGKIINVTQSDDGSIEEDDSVYVFQYPDGRTRIVPETKGLLQRIF